MFTGKSLLLIQSINIRRFHPFLMYIGGNQLLRRSIDILQIRSALGRFRRLNHRLFLPKVSLHFERLDLISGILKHDEEAHSLSPPNSPAEYLTGFGEFNQLDTEKLSKYPPLIPAPDASKPSKRKTKSIHPFLHS